MRDAHIPAMILMLEFSGLNEGVYLLSKDTNVYAHVSAFIFDGFEDGGACHDSDPKTAIP